MIQAVVTTCLSYFRNIDYHRSIQHCHGVFRCNSRQLIYTLKWTNWYRVASCTTYSGSFLLNVFDFYFQWGIIHGNNATVWFNPLQSNKINKYMSVLCSVWWKGCVQARLNRYIFVSIIITNVKVTRTPNEGLSPGVYIIVIYLS